MIDLGTIAGLHEREHTMRAYLFLSACAPDENPHGG
jgi:hypothetical protein